MVGKLEERVRRGEKTFKPGKEADAYLKMVPSITEKAKTDPFKIEVRKSGAAGAVPKFTISLKDRQGKGEEEAKTGPVINKFESKRTKKITDFVALQLDVRSDKGIKILAIYIDDPTKSENVVWLTSRTPSATGGEKVKSTRWISDEKTQGTHTYYLKVMDREGNETIAGPTEPVTCMDLVPKYNPANKEITLSFQSTEKIPRVEVHPSSSKRIRNEFIGTIYYSGMDENLVGAINYNKKNHTYSIYTKPISEPGAYRIDLFAIDYHYYWKSIEFVVTPAMFNGEVQTLPQSKTAGLPSMADFASERDGANVVFSFTAKNAKSVSLLVEGGKTYQYECKSNSEEAGEIIVPFSEVEGEIVRLEAANGNDMKTGRPYRVVDGELTEVRK
ncbi:MAG: hypothetical protein WC717_01995 [Candidatus Micrarchaeia archaeon]|jgi:hypothetical protein